MQEEIEILTTWTATQLAPLTTFQFKGISQKSESTIISLITTNNRIFNLKIV